MDEVKLSVCMMTFNHAAFVRQAVESALAQQTSFPFEIVIGDDCSSDGTAEVLQALAAEHPQQVFVSIADHNRGPGQNFIELFARCRGRYVALLEGDDYWTSPHKLERQVRLLDGRPDLAMSFHPARCVYENGLKGAELLPHDWTRPEATIYDLFERNFIATGSVIFRNRLFPKFPDWFGSLPLGDWPLHILNAAYGNIGFLPDVMSVYRVHASGAWSNRPLSARLDATFEMLSLIDHHFQGKFAAEIDAYRRNTVRWLVRKLPGERSTPISTHDRVVRELARPWQQIARQVGRLWRREVREPPPEPAQNSKAA